MIRAGVETTHVKVPVVARMNEEVRFNKSPAASVKSVQQTLLWLEPILIRIHRRRLMARELLVNTNDAI